MQNKSADSESPAENPEDESNLPELFLNPPELFSEDDIIEVSEYDPFKMQILRLNW